MLLVSGIDGDRIRYSQSKTAHKFNILIPEALIHIIKRYGHGKAREEFLFPIIKRTSPSDQSKDIEWARKRYNKKLKELAVLANISPTITSYLARHSFASIAKNKEIPLIAISEMLGHKSVKTTQIYLASLLSDKRDEYHYRVLQLN